MRYAFALIASTTLGCVSQADYQAPEGHPAARSSTDSAPPSSADPFAVEARSIEASAATSSEYHGDHGMHAMDHAASSQEIGDAQIIEQQLESYPLKTCPVTGEPLGSMGKPVNVVVNNRLVRVCCAGCMATVEGDPAKYLAIVDAAADSDAEPQHRSHEHEGGH